jgi:hypothetical protein
MVKRLTRPSVRVRDPETEGWRFAFVQRCLTRGMHVQEILSACEQSGLFDVVPRKARRRPLSRAKIRSRYLDPLLKQLQAEAFDAAVELRLAYLRYQEAYRYAVAQERPKDMVAAVKGMVDLLGLERAEDRSPESMMTRIQDQLERMDQVMRGDAE